jgi:hypothetical protein
MTSPLPPVVGLRMGPCESPSKRPQPLRVAAANAILDREWGKPESHTNVAHHNKPLRELTDDELYAIIAEGESDEEPEADPEKLN